MGFQKAKQALLSTSCCMAHVGLYAARRALYSNFQIHDAGYRPASQSKRCSDVYLGPHLPQSFQLFPALALPQRPGPSCPLRAAPGASGPLHTKQLTKYGVNIRSSTLLIDMLPEGAATNTSPATSHAMYCRALITHSAFSQCDQPGKKEVHAPSSSH